MEEDLQTGSGSLYNGTNLTRSGEVIIVSINYRLGQFGFLGLPALVTEDFQFGSTGNYGIQDQRAAFQWVQNNIGNFGGDPTRVTLFGESAGAISICYHLAMQRSYGLFIGGIMESGFCNGMNTLENSFKIGMEVANTLLCNPNDLVCLREQTADQVVNANSTLYYWPTIDNVELSQQPIDAIRNGEFVPIGGLILGTNLNEWALWVCASEANLTVNQYENFVYNTFGNKLGKQLLELYNVNNYPTPAQALIDLGSDQVFKCPTRQAARAISNSTISTFLYSFEHVPNYSKGNCLGVAHSFELPFIFQGIANTTLTPKETKLSNDMIFYWIKFAVSVQQIDKRSLPDWPEYDESDHNLVFNFEIHKNKNYRKKECDFWDQIILKEKAHLL